MSPDDPGGVRELRFRHGTLHVHITAAPDNSGEVKVFGAGIIDPALTPTVPEQRDAIKSAVRMLSIARRLAFAEYLKLGGTVEELRESTGSDEDTDNL